MSYIPVTQYEQGNYIQAATEPFERLARLWECENETRTQGLDGNTPRPIAAARWSDVWATWQARDQGKVAG